MYGNSVEDTGMTQRTDQQNAALHLWFRQLAQAMQEADIDMEKLFKVKKVSIPVTENVVKEFIWKQVQDPMVGEKSTTKLETDEISQVYDVVNRHMIENFTDDGLIVPPFPSNESLINESLVKNG